MTFSGYYSSAASTAAPGNRPVSHRHTVDDPTPEHVRTGRIADRKISTFLDCADERWTVSVGDGVAGDSVRTADESNGTNDPVYVETDDANLHEIRADGDVVRSASLPGDPYRFVADGTDRLIVGTRNTIYSITEDAW